MAPDELVGAGKVEWGGLMEVEARDTMFQGEEERRITGRY